MKADLFNTHSEAQTPMTGRAFIRTPALVAALVLALAAPAFAQSTVSPTTDAYGGPQSQVLGNFGGGGQDDVVPPPAAPAGGEAPTPNAPRTTTPVERGGDAPTPSVSTGELPFTGFEAGLVALFGALLLGTGFAMRRASRTTA
jgi:hypothetical protein